MKSGMRNRAEGRPESSGRLSPALLAKGRLIIMLLLLLCVINPEGPALASGNTSSPLTKPDGVAVIRQRRKKRHQPKRRRRAKVYRIEATPTAVESPTAPLPPPPQPQALPEDMPVTGSGPPPSRPTIDASKPGGPRPAKRTGPQIKPPTVQIKPPTE